MEITRETINNSEIRLHITISKLKTILLVCFISFSSLLVRQTLQIQHSCKPMIHWSGEFPTECQVATTDNLNSSDRQELPLSKQIDNKVNISDSKSNFKSSDSKTVSKTEAQSNSHPNQITYGPPAPNLESLQHNTETNLETLPDPLFEPLAFVEYVQENRDDATKIGAAVGVCVATAGIIAGAPITVTIVLATGIGAGVGLLWQGVKSIF